MTEKSTRVRLSDPPKVEVVRSQALREFKAKLPPLSEETVLYYPRRDEPYFVWDLDNRKGHRSRGGAKGDDPASGLGLQVMPTGVGTYRVVYYLHGDQRTIKIGRAGEMSLAEARKRARQIRNDATNGISPRKGKQEKTGTFQECLDRYIDEYQIAKRRNVSAERTRRFLLNRCKRWHDWQLNAIKDRDVDRLLGEVMRRSRSVANLLHSQVGTLFKWAKRKGLIKENPMEGVEKPWDGAQPRNEDWFERDRADQVIRAVWKMADQTGTDEGRFAKLALLLGKRRTAIATMRWEHISAKDWFWVPPRGSRTKKCSAIPLPRLAQRVLGPHKGEGKVLRVRDKKLRALQGRIREHLKIETFDWHGCRHVCESKLAELRVLPHIRDLLLDHAVRRRGAGGIYDHFDYQEPMLEALEKWASHIERLVSPGEGVSVLR